MTLMEGVAKSRDAARTSAYATTLCHLHQTDPLPKRPEWVLSVQASNTGYRVLPFPPRTPLSPAPSATSSRLEQVQLPHSSTRKRTAGIGRLAQGACPRDLRCAKSS